MQPPSSNPSIWLAQTKLRPPLLRADVVARPRLLAQLHAALAACPVTLLAAPAGYGKTTLLAEWLRHIADFRFQIADLARLNLQSTIYNLQSVRVAWLTLDEQDNDPAQFLAALVAAVRQAAPECGATAQALLAGLANPGAEVRRVVGALINDILAALPDPCILALDDLHLLDDPAIYRALEYLLDHLPPQLRLVIATRHDPPLALSRLRARGQLAELRFDSLSFTVDEIAALLNQQLGLDISAAELALLAERTEGWAASLRLLAGSLGRLASADRAALIAGLAQTDRSIFEFLANEVLDRQPTDLRIFLLQTAILPELTPALCQGVTGRADAHALLEDLYRRNLFLSIVSGPWSVVSDAPPPTVDNRQQTTYRYHALFAAFLRQRLAREMPDQLADLHRRAAIAETMPSRAIGHYLAAGLWEPAAKLIEQIGAGLLQQGLLQTLRGWARELPAPLHEARPRLAYQLGVCAWQLGEVAEARTLLQQALHGFDAAGDKVGQGETLTALATSLLLGGDFARGDALVGEAIARAITPHSLVQALMSRTGMAMLWERWAQSEADFATALALIRESGDLDLLRASMVMLHPAFTALPGGLAAIEELAQQAAARLGDEASPARMAAEAQMALVHLLRGRLAAAKEAGERALARSAQFGGYPYMDGDVTAAVAAVYAALGDYPAADRWFDLMLQRLNDSGLRVLVQSGLLHGLGRAHCLQGRIAEARQIYARLCALEQTPELPLAPLMRAMMRGRLAIIDGRHQEAERILRQAAALEQHVRMAVLFGSAHVLLAHLYLCMGRQADALREFERLLADCQQRGIPGIIVIEGALAAPLLRLAAQHGTHAALATQLLEALGDVALRTFQLPETGETLSPREIEVLRLVAQGASNRAIAEQLVLSEETIKSHVARILRKLDVTSRTQAAARARTLGLI
jgi:LuxR family maltose regulon positive regulatory protein